jgi:amino acid adenylation domain-containing protein
MSERLDPRSFVEWVERTSERHGNLVAVTGVGETLTFSEFWDRSMRLARELVALGAGLDDRVGLWAEQSSDLLVGIVGIMAAGAAYVPLDPSYPVGRLQQIAADSGIRLIVAPLRQHDRARSAGIPLVATRFEDDGADRASTPLPVVGPDEAAYVIYTSGSTGRPKGVVIEHHAVLSLLQWMIEDCGMRPGDRVMGTASPAYDASVPTFLVPLATGGTFIALPIEATIDPFELAKAITHFRPRALQASPTMLGMLAESAWAGDKELVVWVGGEQTAASAIRYLAPRVKELCNYYGPTEATVQITVARLGPDDTDAPVGKPPSHVGCHILDPDGREVPQGGTGELYITGPTLARGYLNEPDLTALRFAQISLEGQPPVRAYRTGDLARFRDDGSLMILGRLDDQIKVRGYLIEPREIENRLMEHAGVAEVVVLGRASAEDHETTLIAFVKSTGDLATRELKTFVKEVLPDYMVPADVVQVTSFPLTPNGKVDRRALAELALGGRSFGPLDVGEAAPTDRTDEVLRLFAAVLSVDPRSLEPDDEFFDVGGTSLRCARLFMSIEDRYGLSLPLSTLIAAPTPRRLAEVIDDELSGGPTRGSADGQPRHEWERILSNLWSEILGRPSVRRTDDFFALGGTEADATRMLDQLKSLDGVVVTMNELRRCATIEQLATLIGGRASRASLVSLQTDGANPPFFCIAGAGALAVTFMPLARLLGPDQPFYGLQAHGIERRGVPDYTMTQAARRYAKAIREIQPSGPYLIGGHSLGGAIALRVVHLLEAAGEEVALLAVFDSLLTEAMVGTRFSGHGGNSTAERLSVLPRRPRLSTIVRLPLTGVVPQRGLAQFEVFAGLGQLQAAFGGRLKPWDGSAVVYKAEDEESENVVLGWRCLLTGEWTTVSVPGEHITMLEKSNIAVAAADLRQRITAAIAARAGRGDSAGAVSTAR